MIANKLTLNLSKSNLILIQAKSRGHRANLSLILSPVNSNLPSVSMSKYLSLIFDNSLSFEPHIKNLAGKLSKQQESFQKLKCIKTHQPYVAYTMPYFTVAFNTG